MKNSYSPAAITSTNLALKAALQLIVAKPDKAAISKYYGRHRVYSETLLDLVSAFLEVSTGWTRIARVKLPSVYDKDKVDSILALAERLGLEANVRHADNGLTRREGYGRDSSSGLWDYPLERLPGYEEWNQIEIDKYVHNSQPNSGASEESEKRQAVYVEQETLHDALQLAVERRYEYWKSSEGKLDILRTVPSSGPGLNDIKALVGDLEEFAKLTASFLAEYERGHYQNLVKLALTEGSFDAPASATRETALTQEAREIVAIGRLLGFRVYVRMDSNGRTWRQGYGRCEGSWDYPLNKWPDYLEWVILEIDA
jgi:hypothetical protein